MSSQPSLVLLNRILNLRDGLPFILVVDSLLQSSYYLVKEFLINNSDGEIIYLSFETVNRPQFVTHFIDCTTLEIGNIPNTVRSCVSPSKGVNVAKKSLVIVDSLNFIPSQQLSQFVSSLITPSTVLLGVYHNDMITRNSSNPNYPSPITLLSYIASSVLEVEPHFKPDVDHEQLDNDINRLKIPLIPEINSSTYKLKLTNRRKSGRSVSYILIADSAAHSYQVYKEAEPSNAVEDESLLKDLTTFNLTTNSKNKLAKEQVELPYMEAQTEMGTVSSAIVYEFEKDDDYDEEDPYEDPF